MGSNRLGRVGMTGSLLGPELLTVPIPLPFPRGQGAAPRSAVVDGVYVASRYAKTHVSI